MAGTVSPGQLLTPNRNVFAVAGHGGNKWGAFGGGIVAIGGGATDQTGYVKPVAITAADGETATNYLPGAKPAATVIGQESNAKLSGQVLDNSLPIGTSNAG
jgi:hypothetical protein